MLPEYFEKFPQDVRRIGLKLSGGADSALALFCFSMMIDQRKDYGVEIYPIHGYDLRRTKAKSWEAAERVIEFVQDKFPNVTIHSPYVVAFRKQKSHPELEPYLEHAKEYLQRRYDVEVFVNCITQGLPDMNRPIERGHDQKILLDFQKKYPLSLPFAHIDKHQIYQYYKNLDLLELSLLTVSCIADDFQPCKVCWWCQERYHSFGNYDGGH